jgi:glycosyltransferase involved in cell wall biosynthesis
MNNITTVSIGIPAYNEGQNIQQLLLSLVAQKETGIKLQEIIVVSDGSSDDTAQKVKAVKDKRITLIDDGQRLGKSARLNTLFKTFTGDVLILMDADVLVTDKNLLAKTVKKARLHKTGLAGINALPIAANTFFEHVIEAGVMVIKDTAKMWNNGNNYLSFKGCFMALDGTFARSLYMPATIVNNDAYIYFSAVQAGFSPAYLKESKLYYRSPSTLSDHVKQSSRYQSSKGELHKHFTLDWEKLYKIPRRVMVASVVKSMLLRPFWLLSYIAVFLYAKTHKQTNIKSTWSIASSTKGKISL